MRRAQLPPTLLAVAAGQGGVVSVAQARDHGLSDKDVAGLVRRGTVVRVTRGVYDVGAVPLAGRSWDERRLRAAPRSSPPRCASSASRRSSSART
ncbi:type IV toxin-antitoxin system AbiEi family antitoxin domain-containing protein [Cellulosimicrobium composti]|uniref:type IV toxin-antitoxin system AbiEi family antitoxin domain-containing protein n=1 Tax=Cellulosimicrobium composti TaxID=2672572 RepID=UPI0012BAB20A